MKLKKTIFLFIVSSIFANVDEYISEIETSLLDGKYKEASEIFDTALNEYKSSAKLYYVGAKIFIKLDDLDGANKRFIEAIRLDKKNKDYRSAQKELLELKKAKEVTTEKNSRKSSTYLLYNL